jgi:hypothetical protein
VIGCHPLEEPWIGFVVAGHFQVDKHAPPHKGCAMLESFLASTRCNTERREPKTLRCLSAHGRPRKLLSGLIVQQ